MEEKYACDFFIDIPLASLTSMRLGGTAAIVAYPQNIYSLIETLKAFGNCTIIGCMTNTLPPDGRYDTPVVCTKRCDKRSFDGAHLTAQTGCVLSSLINFGVEKNRSAFPFLAGIPGTVGGAVRGNAGAYGHTISECLFSAKIYDSFSDKIITFTKSELSFSYRNSLLKQNKEYVLLEAVFDCPETSGEKVRQMAQQALTRKRTEQPYDKPSLGSVFLRDETYGSVARLIDESSMKGFAVGGACVSRKHAGFIINNDNATAEDVKKLIAHIQLLICEKYRFTPIPEIEIL